MSLSTAQNGHVVLGTSVFLGEITDSTTPTCGAGKRPGTVTPTMTTSGKPSFANE